MNEQLAVALMVGIPLAGVVVFTTFFLVLGRRVRSLRRQGKIQYSAKTTPGSDVSSSSMGAAGG